MPASTQDADPAAWHRHFAVEANNRAWTLAEQYGGLQAGAGLADTELLDAAHAAAWHWKAIGTELHRMRATMLLAHAHALAGDGSTALALAQEMSAYFLAASDTPDWERAFAHTILAHAAFAAGEAALHAQAHAQATASLSAIADEEDRAIVLKTYRQVPAP